MSEDTERTWLVERTYDDRNLVTLVYATPDGERSTTRELSGSMLDRVDVTAAREVEADRLDPVPDGETRERYRREADRVRDNHAPDDPI